MGFTLDNDFENVVQIKVVGVGGGGGNAVNRMVSSGVQGVEFISVNTDRQALYNSKASHKIQIGEKVTAGKCAGASPDKGRQAAEESKEEIQNALKGSDMVFITAGMGGGTGTGAAPVVAQIAKELGILTIGIVTKPFSFEGKRRMAQAEEGIENLTAQVDSIVVVPNDRLHLVSEQKITLLNAFEMADDILRQGIQSISELIKLPSLINLDFADVTAVMKDAGAAHMGVGKAEGREKAEDAAKKAITSPLLETSIKGARGVIMNVTGGPDLGLEDVQNACDIIYKEAHPDANIIWGAAINEDLEDEIQITVIATGAIDDKNTKRVSKKASSSAPAVSEPQEPQETTTDVFDDNEDGFKDIMELFKR